MKLVLDTSIIIDYLRNGKTGVNFFGTVEQSVEFYIPTIVIFELFSGQSTKNLNKLKIILDFIEFFVRIELNEAIARRSGELSRDLKTTLQIPDYIIAASAMEVGAQVVTLNKKHFEKIPGVNLYNP